MVFVTVIGAIVAFCVFAFTQGRADVVFKIFGYFVAYATILFGLFVGSVYLVTEFISKILQMHGWS